ncbi:TPA: hypothetical protein N0F65_004241 [Lagenidium giganteum]|uniref:Uncharacterized protein n=1 Tax=Lagenidium giganteum TaxID=4803 RepID=A0AAV2ZAX2_9STRA|nr:TPA: hypothetical protein N0F65_004241 [Lagenidium giganteum]
MYGADHCGSDDGSVDEELMFEFDADMDNVPASTIQSLEFRPSNPVAAFLLQTAESEDEDEGIAATNAPTSTPSGESPCASFISCEPPLPFDYNGRKKRKFLDDTSTASSMPRRVRPRARRAKSLCMSSWSGFGGVTASPSSADSVFSFAAPALPSLPSLPSSPAMPIPGHRSDSITIPVMPTPGTVAMTARRPSAHSASSLALQQPQSQQLPQPPTSSWSTTASSSLELFCRHSLHVSSPLRSRFRDLMVGSVGSAGSFSTS